VVEVFLAMDEKTRFTIGGIEFSLSKEEVERKLQAVEPENVREVFVEVHGRRYPIKQALAAATGLLRGEFTTHDAMRVFRRLSLSIRTEGIDPTTMPERCYTMLKSLNEFDKQEIGGVVRGLLAKTDRDNCFIGNYYRGKTNIETLLSLKSAKDLQAIAMVARGLFELAVDTRLIDIIPDAVLKILTFSDVEKLRAAKKIVNFKTANPFAVLDATIHAAFIAYNAQRIEAQRGAVWPGIKKVEHWSGKNLSERVALLGAPFDEIYNVEYPELSWYVHSDLTGFVNLKAESFNMLAAKQNKLAGECYIVLLTAIINEFSIEKADSKVKNKLKLAKMLPFTDGSEQARALELELLS
jgi:hypothetical protein